MSVKRSIAGDGTCPCCGRPGQVKITIPKDGKQARIYFKCVAVSDGGCLLDCMPRHEKSEAWLAGHITRWRDPETKARLGFGEKRKSPEPDTADEPEPDLPAAEVVEAKKPSFWDRDII